MRLVPVLGPLAPELSHTQDNPCLLAPRPRGSLPARWPGHASGKERIMSFRFFKRRGRMPIVLMVDCCHSDATGHLYDKLAGALWARAGGAGVERGRPPPTW